MLLAKTGLEASRLHILDVLEAVLPHLFKMLLRSILPNVANGGLASSALHGMFAKAPPAMQARLEEVLSGTPFVTTVLSDYLEEMAEALEETGATYDLGALRAAAMGKGLPEKAAAIWKRVMGEFGHRGVGELDISTTRYNEEPDMLLEQVLSFMQMPKESRPKGLFAVATRKQTEAVDTCSEWLAANKGAVSVFQGNVKRYHALFRYRESPKYIIIKFVELSRLQVLRQAEDLVKAGRLDRAADVWCAKAHTPSGRQRKSRRSIVDHRYLKLHDLRRFHHDPSIDVREVLQERKALRAQNAHVKSWPKFFTSRGRVLKPKPREAKEGEVAGHPVSAGVVQGRVKVLRAPREKPLAVGEILVAKESCTLCHCAWHGSETKAPRWLL